jgi:tripartite ATP-independent transporter DctM subunit
MITDMSPQMIALIIGMALLVFLFSGFPVSFVLLGISVIGIIIWIKPAALYGLSAVAYWTSTTDYFIALPMFIFMAAILESSGIGAGLYDMMYKWFARLPGGLAIGSVVISTLIAAMSATASTATISMGLLAYPEMAKRGYSKTLAIGSIMGGGCLGPLIPPSVPMILVASLSSISIGKLFISGVFPGLLAATIFILYIIVACLFDPKLGPAITVEQRATWKQKLISLRGVALPVLLIFLVLGFIYLGISTPSEAGGIGAFGALLCAIVYRNLTWRNLKKSLQVSLQMTTMVFWLLITGNAFSSLLSTTGVTAAVGQFLLGVSASPWIVLTIMLGLVFVLGMFIDAGPIAIITIPIFIPIVRALGFDTVWFGLIFTIGLIIGFLTPPFGIVMFYFKGLGHPGVTMKDIYAAAIPFAILLIVVWVLCIVFPEIATWLPNQMIK